MEHAEARKRGSDGCVLSFVPVFGWKRESILRYLERVDYRGSFWVNKFAT